jgi:hypothetical protein
LTILNFDATNVPVAKPLVMMPAGDYLGRIVESELQETKSKDGSMLVLEIEIIEPAEFRGRKIFDRLNIQNPNQTAMRIAGETLSAICHAVGKLRVGDSRELHGYPLCITLGIEKQEGYDPKNRVKGYQPQSMYKAAGANGFAQMGALGTQVAQVAAPQGFGQAQPQGAPFGPATAGAAGFPQQQPQGFPSTLIDQPQFPVGGAAAAGGFIGQQPSQNGQGGALPPGWGQNPPPAANQPQTAAQGAPWAGAAPAVGWQPQPQQTQQPQGTQPGWQPQRQQG